MTNLEETNHLKFGVWLQVQTTLFRLFFVKEILIIFLKLFNLKYFISVFHEKYPSKIEIIGCYVTKYEKIQGLETMLQGTGHTPAARRYLVKPHVIFKLFSVPHTDKKNPPMSHLTWDNIMLALEKIKIKKK